ncbi:Hypothetical predicted protein [Olea europaea subsp. europaea]|uniref:Uncharacterized protein n=1 Tax=Olea europaea subsp. europaea TaxID=158383 RepID=A0A8S0SNW0_OLEEU|nr:Hypothetical predicted protein [Olea europaea subsp. europaea]
MVPAVALEERTLKSIVQLSDNQLDLFAVSSGFLFMDDQVIPVEPSTKGAPKSAPQQCLSLIFALLQKFVDVVGLAVWVGGG